MNAESWSRVRSLFESALELPPEERADHVRQAAGADEGEKREALKLLAHEGSTEGFLEAPEVPASFARLAGSWQPRPGEVIGGYRLEESLGAGGMGSVFAARQERPSRVVALKVMHASSLTGDARKRFEFEAEVLGRLRHPGIAVIHELGLHTTPEGYEVPFFAMEFVEGARDLVTFAREEALDVRARVERLREVCGAVEFAHQKGVVHRDLKPANVLVDRSGRTKVIDYGVARVTDPGHAHGPETMTGYVLGTFGHMAPEQLSAGSTDVDTRADVYALGVLLYQLLAGRLPHETGERPFAETIAQIVTRAPEPPSRHAPGLPPELDWIALKALEIDRERRYPSAASLAEDLGRFLDQQPVLAGPPTRRYRLGKFVARNRWTVAAGVVAVVALVASSVVATLAMLRAEERRVEAETARVNEAAQAEAARSALRRQEGVVQALSSILGAVDPDEDGRRVTLFELLERERSVLDEQLADDPGLRGALQAFLATAYDSLGLYDLGNELLAAAADSMRADPASDPHQLAYLEVLVAGTLLERGRYAEARELLGRALPVVRAAEELAPAARVNAERVHANWVANAGDMLQALDAFERAIELSAELLGPDDPETLKLASVLSNKLTEAREFERAEELARDVWARARATTEPGHPLRLFAAVELANALSHRGVDEELVRMRREILSECQFVHGEFHRNTIQSHEQLARALAATGRLEQAQAEAGQAIRLSELHHPRNADRNMRARLALADVLEIGGDAAGAFEELEQAVALLDEAGEVEHGAFTELTWRLARADLDAGRPEDAEWRTRELVERLVRTKGDHAGKLLLSRAFIGLALAAQGQDVQAEQELRAICDALAGSWDEAALATMTEFLFETLAEACDTLGHGTAGAHLERARALRR